MSTLRKNICGSTNIFINNMMWILSYAIVMYHFKHSVKNLQDCVIREILLLAQ